MFFNLIELIRPSHWLKNLLILIPFIFAFNYDLPNFGRVLGVFAAFSLFASSVYVINDIFDQKRDRLHPIKKSRPIAARKVSTWQAFFVFSVLLIAAFALSVNISMPAFWVMLFYFVINLLYSLGLKNVPIVDVMIIALGFVLRVVVGAVALSLMATHWILLSAFFISLFLAFGKRKNEMGVLEFENKSAHRKSISEYTDSFIDQMLALTAGISIFSYALYTIDQTTVARFGTDNLIYTTPFVVYGIFRYFHLLYNKRDGGDPVMIFSRDLPLKIVLFIWLTSVLFFYFLYHK